MKHTIKDWVFATRFWSFPVSAMPVVAATMFLLWSGYRISWFCAILALIGNVIFHAAGNVLSDYCDFKKGVDNEKAYAVPNLVFHQFEAEEYVRFSATLFSLGIVIGLFLTLLSSWKLLIIGAIGAALAASYPFFKYRSLGDLFVFTCFGILPLIGTSLVGTGAIHWNVLILSLPLGILTVAVLHNNNTVDIATDGEAGIRTVPMALGERLSVELYLVYLVLPYVFVLVFLLFRRLPWTALLVLLSAPAAMKNLRQANGYFARGREAILGLDQKTAQLHLIFSLLLSAGLLIAAIF